MTTTEAGRLPITHPNEAAPPKRRSTAVVMALLVLLVSLITDLRVLPTDGALGQDYNDFYVAAVAQARGLNPYDEAVLTRIEVEVFGYSSFSNTVASPPAFFAAFRPLTALTPRQGYLLWLLVSFAALAVALNDLARLVGCRRDLLFWSLALSPPAIIAAFLGQITLLLVAITIWAIQQLLAGRPWLAGALLALTLVKPHVMIVPVLLLVCLTWRRGGRVAAISIALTLTALSLLATPLAEPHSFANWLGALTRYGSRFDRWQPDISSLAGIYLGLVPRAAGRLLSVLAVLLGLAAAAMLGATRRRRVEPGTADWWRCLALGTTIWLALLPYVHPYDDLLLVIPMALLLAWTREGEPRGLILAAVIALVSLPELDLMGFRPNATFSYTTITVLLTAVALIVPPGHTPPPSPNIK